MATSPSIWIPALLLGCALPAPAGAGDGRIEDNSFLIEEAYNQEPGVVHHISAFQRSWTTREWLYTFTEEWPVGGQDHQLSATLPVARTPLSAGASVGVGDVQLHYRYALFQDPQAPHVVVLRTSLLLPTGERGRALGEGRPGAQVALPVSVKIGSALVNHWNAFGTWFAESWRGSPRETALGFGVGDGLVWLARPSFNLMLEALYTQVDRRAAGLASTTRTLTLNPAFRSSLDFESGLQVVWGVGVPVGVGPSSGDLGVFLYLSFEHPFTSRPASGAGEVQPGR